ncbi:MAG: hypothetical protein ACLVAW_20770 [Eisenbergiella massiliensis]
MERLHQQNAAHESIVNTALLIGNAGGRRARRPMLWQSFPAGIAGSPAAGSVLSSYRPFMDGDCGMGLLISGGLTVAYMLKLYICLFGEEC